jgi:hypothetical protein
MMEVQQMDDKVKVLVQLLYVPSVSGLPWTVGDDPGKHLAYTRLNIVN